MKKFLAVFSALLVFTFTSYSQNEAKKDSLPVTESSLKALKLRMIGPALTSGRIGDIAVNPNNKSEFYVAVASGHVWKTTNKGVLLKVLLLRPALSYDLRVLIQYS